VSALNLALKVHDDDNVATIFALDIKAGTQVEVRDKKGDGEVIKAENDIPYGHKIAVRDITPGEKIRKYGEVIGSAGKPIRKGEHVHVHNLDSTRARGDL
jgi:altronate dehydratase small subunit